MLPNTCLECDYMCVCTHVCERTGCAHVCGHGKCSPWLEDNAVSTLGFERPNYMMQEYVSTAVGVPSLPMGGATAGVWVADVIPPTIIFVASEAVSSNTIQVTLQLDEPGTIWTLVRILPILIQSRANMNGASTDRRGIEVRCC